MSEDTIGRGSLTQSIMYGPLSRGHYCKEGRIPRSIGTNSVQWIPTFGFESVCVFLSISVFMIIYDLCTQSALCAYTCPMFLPTAEILGPILAWQDSYHTHITTHNSFSSTSLPEVLIPPFFCLWILHWI